MLIPVLLFIVGLLCLIKGGDWFVDGATGIARRFHVPELLIGATVVSIGTTLPEVMVSTTSALTGHGEIAYGNAIGSVICIIAAIAGDTSQDLKTGFLLGATPKKQQYGELIGVCVSAVAIGAILYLLNAAWGFGTDELGAPQPMMMKKVV